jgi:hypothetical protein
MADEAQTRAVDELGSRFVLSDLSALGFRYSVKRAICLVLRLITPEPAKSDLSWDLRICLAGGCFSFPIKTTPYSLTNMSLQLRNSGSHLETLDHT